MKGNSVAGTFKDFTGMVVLTMCLAGTPTLCWPVSGGCPDGYTAYPVYPDPVNAEILHGEINPLWIYDNGGNITALSPNYPWSSGVDILFYLLDGWDQDVCVNDSNPEDFFLYSNGITAIYTWANNIPGHVDPSYPSWYHFKPPKPPEGQVVSYTVTGYSHDAGPCNVGDEWAVTSTFPRIFYPWVAGPAIHGTIDKTCIGTNPLVPDVVFHTSATYRWTDQFISWEQIYLYPYDDYDRDNGENGFEPLNWQDGWQYDVLTYLWQADAGWFQDCTEHARMALYVCPSVATWVVATVSLTIDDLPNLADDPAISDNVHLRVYRDHLERDKCNEGDLNDKVAGGPAGACYGAARHAYSGTEGSGGPPWSPATPTRIYEASEDPNEPPTTPLQTSGLNRRGVFILGGNCNHTNTSLGGTWVWEYNGRMNDHRWGKAYLENYIAVIDSGVRVVLWIDYYPFPNP